MTCQRRWRRRALFVALRAACAAIPLLAPLVGGLAQAQCGDYGHGLRWVGHADIGGSPDDMVVSGSLLYAAWGTGFAVFDVSNPARPTLLGTVGSRGWSYGVGVSGTYAFVPSTGGLHVFGVADPARPVLLTTYGRRGVDVAVGGSFAYMADDYGVAVFDIAVPVAPRLINGFGTQGYAAALALDNGTLYVAAGDRGLWVFGLQDPTTVRFSTSIDTPGEARGVAVAGSHVYVADAWGGLHVIDVADPAQPRLVATVRASELGDGGEVNDVAVDGTIAYVTSDSGVFVLDVSNPAVPRLVDRVLGWGGCIAVAASHAYVGASDLDVFAFTPPGTSEVVLGTVGEFFDISDIAVAGSHAYVAEFAEYDDGSLVRDGALKIVDVAERTQPRLVGTLDIADGLTCVEVSGSLVVAGSAAGLLRTIDVSAPDAPRIVGFVEMDPVVHVAVSGPIAYAAGYDTLNVIDVSTPSAPVHVGTMESFDSIKGIAVSGAFLYVLDGGLGLVVVDVSDPAKPVVRGNVNGPWAYGGRDIAVSGTHVYVSTNFFAFDWRRGDGFWVIDVADPASPQVVSHIPCGDGHLAVQGAYAYVATEWGTMVVDVAVPTAPVLAGGWNDSPYVYDVAVDGMSVYTAGDGRLEILPAPCSPTAVAVFDLAAERREDGVLVHWRTSGSEFTGFEVWRSLGAEERVLGRAERDGDSWEFWDRDAAPGETYRYRVVGALEDGSSIDFGPVVAGALLSAEFMLEPVWPSPVREGATIAFTVPWPEMVSVEIFDARGRRIRRLVDAVRGPGRTVTSWDGRGDGGESVGSGVYFVRMRWASGSLVRRAALVR